MSIVSASNYDILIDEPYDRLNQIIDDYNPSKIFVIVDSNTEAHCLPLFKEKIHADFLSIRIPAGEQYKNIQVCSGLWETLVKNQADRKSLVFNLGGGVVGDMGGFIAGTYMRGIQFIQIPTTLLSQVDASVGGKLGIDFKGYKNMVGLFLDPQCVWIDTTYLKTLDKRELRSGFAEVIKHALVRSKALWLQINASNFDLETANWKKIVIDNVEIKNYIVQQDFKESGLRKILNFGHTVGHAIESYYLNTESPLTHGESIIIGMHCESTISHLLGYLDSSSLNEIHTYLNKVYKANLKLGSISNELLALMMHDKKNSGSEKRFSLLSEIGKGNFDNSVEDSIIKEALSRY